MQTQNTGLETVLRAIRSEQKTGTLTIRGAGLNEEASFEFIQGRLVAALCDAVNHEKAVWRVFLWDRVRSLFTPKNAEECEVEEKMAIGLDELIFAGSHQKERFEKIRQDIPPLTLELGVVLKALRPMATEISSRDFPVLASVVEWKTVDKILDYNPLPDVDIYESLVRLRRNQVLRVVKQVKVAAS